MQVTVEKTSELRRKMTISIPDEVVLEKMESRIKSIAREVKIDGFRPGKAPAKIVQKLYGDRVRNEIAGDLIQSSYYEALQKENLTPIGQPFIQPLDTVEKFEFVAEFEVYPEISLDSISRLQVIRPVASVTDDDVNVMIEKLRRQKKTWNAVERSSQDGDRVTMHFSGVCEGESFTNGKAENFSVEIGAAQVIPGFEEQLIGVKVGEHKAFTTTFPEQYSNQKLAGKNAEFEIEVVNVEEPILPEIDAEFIKAYGVDAGEIESFRKDVKDNMERELQNGLKSRLKNSVLDILYDNLTVEVPSALVDQELGAIMNSYAEQARRVGQNPETLKDAAIVETFEAQAKRRVGLSLIMSEILKVNNIVLDPFRVRALIDEISKSYEDPNEVVTWYYADKSRLNDVQQMVLEEQAIEWIVSQVTVTEQALSFTDVMEKQQLEA